MVADTAAGPKSHAISISREPSLAPSMASDRPDSPMSANTVGKANAPQGATNDSGDAALAPATPAAASNNTTIDANGISPVPEEQQPSQHAQHASPTAQQDVPASVATHIPVTTSDSILAAPPQGITLQFGSIGSPASPGQQAASAQADATATAVIKSLLGTGSAQNTPRSGETGTLKKSDSANGSGLNARAPAFVPGMHSPTSTLAQASVFTPPPPPPGGYLDAHDGMNSSSNGSLNMHGSPEGNGLANGMQNAEGLPDTPDVTGVTDMNGYGNGMWDEMGFDDMTAYQNGWGKGFDAYGYGMYPEYGPGYTMTPDGLWIPHQMDPAWAAAMEAQAASQAPMNYGYANGFSSKRHGRGHNRAQQASEANAALAVLQEQFPLYNKASLNEVLKVHGFDLVGTLDMLAQLEAEQSGQRRHLQQAPPSLDENNFPSLAAGACSAVTSPATSGATAMNGNGLANGHSNSNNVDKASSSDGSDDEPAGDAANGHAAADTAPTAASAWGRPLKVNSGEVTENGGTQQQAAARRARKDRPSAKTNGSKHKQSAVPWVETGAAVAGQYADAREEARDHARLRNMYFQQATQAYLYGNKALAKELGAKGRNHSEQMKKAHAAASENIFQQRNPRANSAVFNKNGVVMLDLHGLHVSEGLRILSRELSQLRDNVKGRVPIQVHVLTGTGHHTKGRTPARLPVAVETYLQGEGIKFDKPEAGVVKISL